MANAQTDSAQDNPMREVRLAKVVVNIGVGEAGDQLIKAEKVMEMITGKTPSRTISTKTNRDWGLREGMPIGVKVTLRGDDAVDFVKRALWARDNKISWYSFDDGGNLNFGIPDYTEFEAMKYDPDIGIFGLDVAVVLERAGGRVRHRRVRPASLPPHQRVSRNEAIDFIKATFPAEVVE